jgi:sulfatase modifying factor 1
MKNLKTLLTVTAGACALASSASAMIEIDTSYVGDAGNANDGSGYGGVSYDYHVGTYEVTNSQDVSFLNAKGTSNTHGVFNANMESNSHGGIQQDGTSGSFTYSVKSGMGQRAVNYVGFWDAARFTNWLTNGQGSGSTETGVYTLGNVTNPTNNTVTRNTGAWDAGGVGVASEDEWYKAAYYQPVGDGGDTDSYWLYPTASNSIATADANYGNNIGTLTDVGTYSDDASYYGTFDQGGNVWEWNDAIVSSSFRGLRGGAFSDTDANLQSSSRAISYPTYEDTNIGFRVSSPAPIPEPSSYAAMFGCLAAYVCNDTSQGAPMVPAMMQQHAPWQLTSLSSKSVVLKPSAWTPSLSCRQPSGLTSSLTAKSSHTTLPTNAPLI